MSKKMKTSQLWFKKLFLAIGLLLTVFTSCGYGGGWFLPTQLPAGESHRFWAIGLSTPLLEQNTGVRTMKDGTHVFAFTAGNGAGHIYIWDRISPDYNSPAVASTDARFGNYATLDLNNMTFLKNIYSQLHEMWGENGNTKEQGSLLSKLRTTIMHFNGGRPF